VESGLLFCVVEGKRVGVCWGEGNKLLVFMEGGGGGGGGGTLD